MADADFNYDVEILLQKLKEKIAYRRWEETGNPDPNENWKYAEEWISKKKMAPSKLVLKYAPKYMTISLEEMASVFILESNRTVHRRKKSKEIENSAYTIDDDFPVNYNDIHNKHCKDMKSDYD